MDSAPRFDHSERMNRSLLIAIMLAVIGGCGTPVPTKSVQLATEPAPPQYISAQGQAPSQTSATKTPRPIYDYHVAPAQYSLKPLQDWTEQEAAAEALGRIGPAALPQLVELLRSERAEVRLIAAQVIARMGSDAKDAVPALIPLLDDPDERVRKAATRTLGRIGPDAAAAVPELLKALVEPAGEAPAP